MSDNLHTVDVTTDDYDYIYVAFHCAGDETAPCHNYPSLREQTRGDDHASEGTVIA